MPASSRLDSWKEIAAHLGCDVSTAQRWEKERALPIRRVPGGKRQAVFALSAELDAWLASKPPETSAAQPLPELAPAPRPRWLIPSFIVIAVLLAAALAFVFRVPRPARDSAQRPAFARIAVPAAYRMAIGDLNEDGIPDMLVSSMPGRIVSVVLGDGKGGALSVRGYEACAGAHTVVVADFDQDGHQDAAVGCMYGPAVVFWGDGSGTLGRPTPLESAGSLLVVAAGDIDNDGTPDLVGTNSENIVSLLARGRDFIVSERHPIGHISLVSNIALVDLDGDNKNDMVVTLSEEGQGKTVLRFLNTGGGKMRPLSPLVINSAVGYIASADFNRDGIMDLAIGETGRIEVLLGAGHGELRPAPLVNHSTIDHCIPIVAYFNNDGIPDLAFTDLTGQSVNIRYGRGNGEFSAGPTFVFDAPTYFLAAADFDRDGRPDLAISLGTARTISFIPNSAITHH